MRLNTKRMQEIMIQKNLTEENICTRTGLDKHSLRWIFDNGFVSEDAMERIAGAADVQIKEILLPEITGTNENAIEFITDSKRATVTFTQGRYKSRIKKLAKSHPEECQIVAENQDGSLCAHIPVEWVRINPSKELSVSERERLSNHAKNILNNRNISRESDQISTEPP